MELLYQIQTKKSRCLRKLYRSRIYPQPTICAWKRNGDKSYASNNTFFKEGMKDQEEVENLTQDIVLGQGCGTTVTAIEKKTNTI